MFFNITKWNYIYNWENPKCQWNKKDKSVYKNLKIFTTPFHKRKFKNKIKFNQHNKTKK